MKKHLILILLALVVGASLQARRGGRGGHRGGRGGRHGFRGGRHGGRGWGHRGGWGRRGWGGVGFGISLGGPRYYGGPAYGPGLIADPYDYYYTRFGNPFSDLDAYRRWLIANEMRFGSRDWRYWWGRRGYYRGRPRFSIGVGI